MNDSPTLQVRWRDQGRAGGKGLEGVHNLPSDQALEQILSGDAQLCVEQSDPPFEVLAKAADFAEDIEKLGPPTTDARAFEKIDSSIFRNGMRQTMVAGQTLFWAPSYKEMKHMVEVSLCACSNFDSNIFEQLRKICSRCIWNSPEKRADRVLSEEYMAENLLVKAPQSIVITEETNREYFQLEPLWYQFYCELDVLNKSIDETIKHALVEGRILVGEDTPKGDRFISPELASSISPSKRKPQYHFVLTRDMPSEWFSSVETLANRKTKAKRWLERAYVSISEFEKRWSGTDAKIVIREKFDLTPNAANDVWRESDIPNRGEPGNIPENERADISLLREFN